VLDAAGNPTGQKQNIFSYPPIGSRTAEPRSPAEDLVGFAQAVRAGRLLSAELTEQFLTPQVLHHQRDDWAVWYGFGLECVIDRAGAVRNTYKDGASAGVSGSSATTRPTTSTWWCCRTQSAGRGRRWTRSTG
jgi:hypothetical protein